jgi:hypothetical protein
MARTLAKCLSSFVGCAGFIGNKMMVMRSGHVTKFALRLLLVICIGTLLCWLLMALSRWPVACHPQVEVKALVVITSHAGNVRGRMAWRNGLPTNVIKFNF